MRLKTILGKNPEFLGNQLLHSRIPGWNILGIFVLSVNACFGSIGLEYLLSLESVAPLLFTLPLLSHSSLESLGKMGCFAILLP